MGWSSKWLTSTLFTRKIFQHRLGVLTRSIARTPLLSPAEMAGSEMQRNAPKPWDPTKDREKPCWNCLELVVESHWLLTIYLPVYMPRKLWKQCVLHVLQKNIHSPYFPHTSSTQKQSIWIDSQETLHSDIAQSQAWRSGSHSYT